MNNSDVVKKVVVDIGVLQCRTEEPTGAKIYRNLEDTFHFHLSPSGLSNKDIDIIVDVIREHLEKFANHV